MISRSPATAKAAAACDLILPQTLSATLASHDGGATLQSLMTTRSPQSLCEYADLTAPGIKVTVALFTTSTMRVSGAGSTVAKVGCDDLAKCQKALIDNSPEELYSAQKPATG